MNKHLKKKLLVKVLSVVMALSMIAVTVLAEYGMAAMLSKSSEAFTYAQCESDLKAFPGFFMSESSWR